MAPRFSRVGRSRYEAKPITGAAIPLARAMRRFCGFPIGVTTLPVVTAKASVRRSGLGEMFSLLERVSMIGVPISARVSFIRKAEPKAKPKKVR